MFGDFAMRSPKIAINQPEEILGAHSSTFQLTANQLTHISFMAFQKNTVAHSIRIKALYEARKAAEPQGRELRRAAPCPSHAVKHITSARSHFCHVILFRQEGFIYSLKKPIVLFKHRIRGSPQIDSDLYLTKYQP
jgi:hypothetical protein